MLTLFFYTTSLSPKISKRPVRIPTPLPYPTKCYSRTPPKKCRHDLKKRLSTPQQQKEKEHVYEEGERNIIRIKVLENKESKKLYIKAYHHSQWLYDIDIEFEYK